MNFNSTDLGKSNASKQLRKTLKLYITLTFFADVNRLGFYRLLIQLYYAQYVRKWLIVMVYNEYDKSFRNTIPFSGLLLNYSYFVYSFDKVFVTRTRVFSLKNETSRSLNSNRIYSFFLTFCTCIFQSNGYKKRVKKIREFFCCFFLISRY